MKLMVLVAFLIFDESSDNVEIETLEFLPDVSHPN